MAFEEEEFYPALADLLGDTEVRAMYAEHRAGLEVVAALRDQPSEGSLDPQVRDRLVAQADEMGQHIAECGELFETMGRLSPHEQADLYERLERWRRLRCRWTSYVRITDVHRGRPATGTGAP